jgi:hypothetical protein
MIETERLALARRLDDVIDDLRAAGHLDNAVEELLSIRRQLIGSRPTFTYKGAEFDSEFRALINKAAERTGMTQALQPDRAGLRQAQGAAQSRGRPDRSRDKFSKC